MTSPQKLPDIITHIFGKQARLTERELVTIYRNIGPKGEWVQIRFVLSRAVPT
jgi:hypothetical protein